MAKALVATYVGYVTNLKAADVESAAVPSPRAQAYLHSAVETLLADYLAEPDGLTWAETKAQSGYYEVGEKPPPLPRRDSPWPR
jgi:hypothetical protein